MTRFLVTGASGLLGLNFSLQACELRHIVFGTVNQHRLVNSPFPVFPVDLAIPGRIEAIINQSQPDVIIHTAALADIDACERQPELSRRVNAELPGEIAEIAQKKNIQLIHISTDAVFDGLAGNYNEEDIPNPLNTYARHKLAGEKAVMAANADAAIARVNFFGWSINGKRSLAEYFYKNLSEGQPVKGFTDIIFCPLLVNDLVDLLIKMADRRVKGIYHVLSTETISKYEFGLLIAREFNLDASLISPVSWKDGGLEAVRSPNLIFNVTKIINDLGITPPSPAAGIKKFHQLWLTGYASRIRSMSQPDSKNI